MKQAWPLRHVIMALSGVISMQDWNLPSQDPCACMYMGWLMEWTFWYWNFGDYQHLKLWMYIYIYMLLLIFTYPLSERHLIITRHETSMAVTPLCHYGIKWSYFHARLNPSFSRPLCLHAHWLINGMDILILHFLDIISIWLISCEYTYIGICDFWFLLIL